MMQWACYWRTDAKLECGTPIEPIPIRRWRCLEHGTYSFLPPFFARYIHYLVYVVRVVQEWLIDYAQSLETLLEVTGPSVDTVRRWVWQLTGPNQQRWLCQYCPAASDESPHHKSHSPERSRTLAIARFCAISINLISNSFPILLQRARLSNMTRYKNWPQK
jgi:hypothetical protein